MHLVKLRISLILSLQNIITRNTGASLGGTKIKQLTDDLVAPVLEEDEHLAFTGQVSKQTIDFLTRQIKKVEKKVRGRIKLKKEYTCLNTIPGVGGKGLVENHETCPILLDTAWHRRFSGPLKAEGAGPPVVHALILMGDWCGEENNHRHNPLKARHR